MEIEAVNLFVIIHGWHYSTFYFIIYITLCYIVQKKYYFCSSYEGILYIDYVYAELCTNCILKSKAANILGIGYATLQAAFMLVNPKYFFYITLGN